MEAKAAYPHSVIRAFTGRTFVKYEWRPVPAGCEDEAQRLELGGYLILKAEVPEKEPVSDLESMSVAKLRDEAKALGVPYSGLRKAELIAALGAVNDNEEE